MKKIVIVLAPVTYLNSNFYFLFLISVLWLSGCSSDKQINETKQRGNQIIQALERFRIDHGCYPKTLTDLGPKYIQEIPLPTWGLKTWQYEAHGNEYTLRVDESIYTGDGDSHWLRYQGEKWGWQIGD